MRGPGTAATPLTLAGLLAGIQRDRSLQRRRLRACSLAFSGTGAYSGGGTWTIAGQIKDARLMATIAYDGQTYKVFLVGKVAADGSVSGTGRTRVAGAGPIGHATGTEAAQGIINALYQPGNIHSELVFHLAVVNGSNEPKMQRRGEVLK